MVEWVLDTQYKQLFDRDRWAERSILVYEAGESQLIPAMEAVEARFPDVKVFSLPRWGRTEAEFMSNWACGQPCPSRRRDGSIAPRGIGGRFPLQMKSPALSGASLLPFGPIGRCCSCPVWRLRGPFWLREALHSFGCGSNVRLGDLGRLLRDLVRLS